MQDERNIGTNNENATYEEDTIHYRLQQLPIMLFSLEK